MNIDLIRNRYQELVSLSQIFLLREYTLNQIKITDPSSYSYFQRKMPPTSSAAPLKKSTSIPIPSANSQEVSRPLPTNQTVIPQQSQTAPKPPILDNKPPVVEDQHPKAKKTDSSSLTLESLNPSPSQNLQEFWKIFKDHFPDYHLSETIPSDASAKKIKNAWSSTHEIPSVILLSFNEQVKQIHLLKNIAQAISLRFAPAKVLSASLLEEENLLDKMLNASHLRLVIASDYGLYLQPSLMRFYKEAPQKGKHYLHNTPLLLLSDLSLYLKEPQLKSLLWRAICNEFVTSQPSPAIH